MQKSIISTQINQDDMKKYSSTRKVDAVKTKTIAPFALISRISFSSSLSIADLEDPLAMKEKKIHIQILPIIIASTPTIINQSKNKIT